MPGAHVTGVRSAGHSGHAVAGVVLAAGLARRFGGGKLAAPLDGRPIVAHVLDIARSALEAGDIASVVVVAGSGPAAGPDAPTVRAMASSHGLSVVDNDDPAAGLSRSVRLALAALEATEADGALMLLGDQPRVRPGVIRAIVAAAAQKGSGRPGFVIPRYGNGGAGNPVLIDRSMWPLAAALDGDVGMVAVARERPDRVLYVEVEGANPDVDTPEELDALDAADG